MDGYILVCVVICLLLCELLCKKMSRICGIASRLIIPAGL